MCLSRIADGGTRKQSRSTVFLKRPKTIDTLEFAFQNIFWKQPGNVYVRDFRFVPSYSGAGAIFTRASLRA